MLKFKKLTVRNFLSVGNIPLEIHLNKAPLTLIYGDSGTGKSTLTSESLCFVLFDKSYRGLNKPQLVNSINGRDAEVTVEFDTNGHSYKIIRGIKPAKFEIWEDDKELEQDSTSRNFQQFLEERILKMNMKMFRQISILSVSNYIPFMELESRDRRKIIEDLLDIQIFAVMNNLLKDNVAELTTKKKEIKAKEKQINQLIKAQKEKIESLRSKDTQFKQGTVERIEEIQKEVEELNDTLKELNASIKTIGYKESVHNKAKKEKEKVSASIATNDWKLAELKKKLREIQTEDFCTHCKQPLTSEHKSSHEVEIKDNAKQVLAENKELKKKLKELTSVVEEQQSKKDNARELTSESSIISTLIFDKTSSIESLQKIVDDIDNDSKDEYTKEEAKLVKLEEGLEKTKNILEELFLRESDYEVCKAILKDTGVKAKIIKQFIPILNAYLHDVLSKMNFPVRFSFDETFNETVLSRYRDDFTYANFSAGEKVRINLAITLAFREISKLKNSVSTNLLIIDEAVDALDSNNIDRAMEFFDSKHLGDVSVFLISHKVDVIDKSRFVIALEKDRNGFTVIKPNL